MIFIDFLTLLLINMSAGFIILAAYVFRGLDDENQPRWSLGFFPVGLIALIFGGYIAMYWPLPGQFNAAYGDMSVLFGVIFLFAGLGMAMRWKLSVIAAYAFPAGVGAIVVGIQIWMLQITKSPALTAAGFVLSGLAGVCAFPTTTILRNQMNWRLLAAAVLLLVALIWMVTAYAGIVAHMSGFKAWMPQILEMSQAK